jgi:hypothetical protein
LDDELTILEARAVELLKKGIYINEL